MDLALNIATILLAGATVVFIAFPQLLIGRGKEKKEKVGAVYWGVYDGLPNEEPEVLKTIEVKKKRGKEKVVAGSATYAMGRAPSTRC